MHYCIRISDKEFEKQRNTESKEALIELLDQIINSSSMSSKEKAKRIKLVSFNCNYISKLLKKKKETKSILILFKFVAELLLIYLLLT